MTVSYVPIATQIPLSQLAAKNGWTVTTDPYAAAKPADDTAQAEFSRAAKMTPAEQMRGAMLNKLGIAEDQLGSMPPEQRKLVEDRLRDMVRQTAQADFSKDAQTGLIADISA